MNGFVKSFVYPFIVSLVIFSILAFAFVRPVLNIVFSDDTNSDSDMGEDDLNNDLSSTGPKSDATGVLSLLLIGTDEIIYNEPENPDSQDPEAVPTPDDPDASASVEDTYGELFDKHAPHPSRTVDFITLISFDSTNARTVITSIPNIAYVSVSGINVDMDTAYYYIENQLNGLDYTFFADYVSCITGMPVDFYAYIDTDDFSASFDEWGSIPVNLDENVVFYDESTFTSTTYNAGSNNIDSKGLYELIKYDGYVGTFTKANLLAAVANFVLEKTATSGYYVNFENHFNENVSKFYNTNVTYEAFSEKLMLYFSYQFYKTNILNVIGDLTTTSDGENRLAINRASTLRYFKQ